MIGLITSDEVMYAGGTVSSSNNEYYLYSGKYYWTMTPYSYAFGLTFVGFVYIDGGLSDNNVTNPNAVRPVVSLKSDAISGGSGTAANPFFVG